MAAVALRDALEDRCGLDARIKWPNDVLLKGRKVAGILAEMDAEQERIHVLILGIGVNLNMTRDMFPENPVYPPTSVALELGRSVSRVEFARHLLLCLDERYETLLKGGAEVLRRDWMRHCAHPSDHVVVHTPTGDMQGRFAGLAHDGAMLLHVGGRTAESVRIHAGDVTRMTVADAERE